MHTGTVAGGGVTRVGSDGLYMVGSHVAHDCVVGDSVVFANNATLGGHVRSAISCSWAGSRRCTSISRIGRYAFVGGGAIVTKDVIPFGSVWGNHAHLEGLNLVGLKRRGFSRETINDLRAAYRLLFADEGTFQERLDDTARLRRLARGDGDRRLHPRRRRTARSACLSARSSHAQARPDRRRRRACPWRRRALPTRPAGRCS